MKVKVPKPPESYAVVSVTLQHKGRVTQHSVALTYPSKVYVIDAATEALKVAVEDMDKIIAGMRNFANASALPELQPLPTSQPLPLLSEKTE